MNLNYYISLTECLVMESHPSSSQSRLRAALGDRSYKELSRDRGPGAVKCSAKAREARKNGASEQEAKQIYNNCMDGK